MAHDPNQLILGDFGQTEAEQKYKDFTDKFKTAKTTDDCYTPPLVYDTILDWVCKRYGLQKDSIVRPFYPGGDYVRYRYPDGCVVCDNPPFSILSQIIGFYMRNNIRFFLFGPSLTIFSGRDYVMQVNHIVCDCDIEYANGAKVRTSFVTNLDTDIVAESAPDLTAAINSAVSTLRAENIKPLPKYTYPDYILTAAMLQRFAKSGVRFAVNKKDCAYISKMDAQRQSGKGIFGGGLILSESTAAERAAAERAAAERAAAERAAATVWALSAREKKIVESLGREDG